MSRARTEQSDVNNFILHVYLMYANQLEHKKKAQRNCLAEEGNCGITVPARIHQLCRCGDRDMA